MYISGLRKVFVNSHFCNLFGYQIKKKNPKNKKQKQKQKKWNQTKKKNHYSYIFFSESLSLHVPYDKV